MRTTISKFKYVVILAVITAFVSCKGDIGPAGPAGTDGTNGIDGTDGTDGNANVTASDWITPTWSQTGTTSGDFIYDDSTITADFMSTGVVLSYMDWYGDTARVYPVPFTYQAGGTVSYNYVLFEGKIDWWFSADHDYTPPSGAKFRYVLIPASTSNKSANPQQEILYNIDKAGVDIHNYYQVMNYFGLEY